MVTLVDAVRDCKDAHTGGSHWGRQGCSHWQMPLWGMLLETTKIHWWMPLGTARMPALADAIRDCELLTRWRNPAAVNQVLITIDNSLESFTELLKEQGQRTVRSLQAGSFFFLDIFLYIHFKYYPENSLCPSPNPPCRQVLNQCKHTALQGSAFCSLCGPQIGRYSIAWGSAFPFWSAWPQGLCIIHIFAMTLRNTAGNSPGVYVFFRTLSLTSLVF